MGVDELASIHGMALATSRGTARRHGTMEGFIFWKQTLKKFLDEKFWQKRNLEKKILFSVYKNPRQKTGSVATGHGMAR